MYYLILISFLASTLCAQAYHSFYDMIEIPKELAYQSKKEATASSTPTPSQPQEIKDISVQEETIRQIVREELQAIMKKNENQPAASANNTPSTSNNQVIPAENTNTSPSTTPNTSAVATAETSTPPAQPIEYFDHKTGKMVQISREEFNQRLDKHLREAIHH